MGTLAIQPCNFFYVFHHRYLSTTKSQSCSNVLFLFCETFVRKEKSFFEDKTLGRLQISVAVGHLLLCSKLTTPCCISSIFNTLGVDYKFTYCNWNFVNFCLFRLVFSLLRHDVLNGFRYAIILRAWRVVLFKVGCALDIRFLGSVIGSWACHQIRRKK